MPPIRDLKSIASKWQSVTSAAGTQYEQGVKNPKQSWEANTAIANDSYNAGIHASISKDSFVKGVKKAGQATWQKGAVEKGTARFGPGVTVAQADYEKGFQPYRDAIEKTTLPARFARRDPRNLERVRAQVNAVIAEKQRQIG